MSEDVVGMIGEDSRSRRWRLPFTWLGLLFLCFVLYELTKQPALGAIAVCLKFGWDDFLTARWLWRTDPNRRRGVSCLWLYVAWGLWKTALVAFLMSVGFALVAPQGWAAGGAALLRSFASTFLTTLLGFFFSALATFLAVSTAWRGGYRLWLDRAVHRARRHNLWPPSPLCEGRTNRLGQVLLTAIALVTSTGLLLALAFAAAALRRWTVVLLPVMLIIAPVVILVIKEELSRRVRARSPYECWGEKAGPMGWVDEPIDSEDGAAE
jgi:hypothetical protein